MKPWFYNEQSITEFKEPVVYKGLNISVSKTKVKPPYIAVVTSPATSKEVLRTGGATEQEALDSAKQAIDKREADAPKISASGQTSVLLNVPSNDELLKDPTMYNTIYAKISKDQNGPTLVIGNEVYGAADLEADGFVRSYDRRMKKNRDSEDALPQIMFNASNKTLSQIGIKMNGRYTLDIEGKYRDDNEHTVYPLQFQGSTIHAGDKLRMSRPALTIGATREDAQPWFQREFEEAEIIKFPEPVKNVVELPNVQSYPDFLTGVKDLHSRRDRGEISQDSHDKLYADLIQRFMRKESFENPWFLREAPADGGIMSLPQAQRIKALSKQIGQLPPDVSDRIIDKIASAIELAQNTGKDKTQNKYLKVSRAVKNIDDSDLKKYYKTVSKFMIGNDLTSQEISNIIKSINDNTCIDVEQLKKPTNTLSNIIKKDLQSSTELQKYFNDMLLYQPEQGIGPGEILFATHSKELMKGSKGDLLIIDSQTPIEVKGGVYKGRFKDDDIKPSPDYYNKASTFMKKYASQIQIPPSGVNYTKLTDAIHNAEIDKQIRNQMYKDFQNIITDLFPQNPYTKEIIKAVKSNDSKKALNFHGMANLDAYFRAKQAEGGMGILFIDRKGGTTKTSYAENLPALLKGFNLSVDTAYPISTTERNPFAQMGVVQK